MLLKKWSGGQFYKSNPFKRNFWKSQSFAQKNEGSVNFEREIPLTEKYENLRSWLQITNWNPILLAWYFKNTLTYRSFEKIIPTPQLDIKFWNFTQLYDYRSSLSWLDTFGLQIPEIIDISDLIVLTGLIWKIHLIRLINLVELRALIGRMCT